MVFHHLFYFLLSGLKSHRPLKTFLISFCPRLYCLSTRLPSSSFHSPCVSARNFSSPHLAPISIFLLTFKHLFFYSSTTHSFKLVFLISGTKSEVLKDKRRQKRQRNVEVGNSGKVEMLPQH